MVIVYNTMLKAGRGSAWLERLLWEQDVGGSNPLAPTMNLSPEGTNGLGPI